MASVLTLDINVRILLIGTYLPHIIHVEGLSSALVFNQYNYSLSLCVVCIYVCVCMYVRVHIYKFCVCERTYMCMYACKCMCVHAHSAMYVCDLKIA